MSEFIQRVQQDARGLYPSYLLQKKQPRNLPPNSSGNIDPDLFFNTLQMKIDVGDYETYSEIMETRDSQVITTPQLLQLMFVCAANAIIKMHRKTTYFSNPPLMKAHPWMIVIVSDLYTQTEMLNQLWRLTQDAGVVVKGIFGAFPRQEVQKQYIEMGTDVLVSDVANIKRLFECGAIEFDVFRELLLMDAERLSKTELQHVLNLKSEFNA